MSPTELNLHNSANLGEARPDREGLVKKSIRGICADWFPDNEDNAWHIEATAYMADRAFVLVRPDPNDVGYDRFVVLVVFESPGSALTAHAMYSEDEESKFGLLGTAPNCPDDVPSVVIW